MSFLQNITTYSSTSGTSHVMLPLLNPFLYKSYHYSVSNPGSLLSISKKLECMEGSQPSAV